MHKRGLAALSLVAAALSPGCSCGAPPAVWTGFADGAGGARIVLSEGWFIQSSTLVRADDAAITGPRFSPTGWHPASVPTTVVAALVEDKSLPDPYWGMNLRSFAGVDYPVQDAFWLYPMADDSPYRAPWWFRTSFALPAQPAGARVWLRASGVNYRADVWMNGVRIADSSTVVGAFRDWEFDVTDAVIPGGSNVLALKITPPDLFELSWNWVDWSPFPPDKNLGIVGEVSVVASGPVHLGAPAVSTRVPSLDEAVVSVSVEASNASDRAVSATIDGHIEARRFGQTVSLAAGETRVVRFEAAQFPDLDIHAPALWWPIHLGAQPLQNLALTVSVDGRISDDSGVRFGLREITSERIAETNVRHPGAAPGEPARVFFVNGQRVLIRGAGWAPDMLLRHTAARTGDELRYVRDMNLNAIRLEGKLGLDPLSDLADEYGILVIAGVCCCDWWERYTTWGDETHRVAIASIGDQVKRLRAHPSTLAWLDGSDNMPPPDIEQAYLDAIAAAEFPGPVLPSAAGHVSTLSGPSGVKMAGPYEYVPPSFWLLDKSGGGAFGFNTETSIGAAPPALESLRKFLPPEHLWPVDELWTFHGGNSTDTTLFGMVPAVDARLGRPSGLPDFLQKSELLEYEGVRAMFEAFGRNKYKATGVIQWMLNTPWPGVVWHLYDYYLKPSAGFFAAQKACEPLHVQYSYDDRSVVVVNSTREARVGLGVHAEVRNLDGRLVWTRDAVVDVGPDGVTSALSIPTPGDGWDDVYLVRLALRGSDGTLVTDNDYGLARRDDTLNADSTVAQFGDYRALGLMPAAPVTATASRSDDGVREHVLLHLRNPGPGVAHFIRIAVTRGPDGDEILPARWSDNDVTLMPGEQRDLSIDYRVVDRLSPNPVLSISGWNVPPTTIALR